MPMGAATFRQQYNRASCQTPPPLLLFGDGCQFRSNRFRPPPHRPPTVLQPPARLPNPLSTAATNLLQKTCNR